MDKFDVKIELLLNHIFKDIKSLIRIKDKEIYLVNLPIS
jgi:hypothetical protein